MSQRMSSLNRVNLEKPRENEIDSESNWVQVVDNFEDMGLKPELLRGIETYGWKRPSGIQQRAILPADNGRNLVVRSQAGTGKTGALAISVLQKVNVSVEGTQALILVATRELAQQLQTLIVAMGNFTGIKCHAFVGGVNLREDIAKVLADLPHIVVGTPGRVFEMIRRNVLKTEAIKIFCFDEADELFARGFKDQIYETFELLPKGVQVILFSATLSAEVLEATQTFMSDPIKISVKRHEVTIEGFKHYFVSVEKEEDKLEKLVELYKTMAVTQAVVFCRLKRTVNWLTETMHARGLKVSAINPETEETLCQNVMDEFRSGSSRVLITTDLFSSRVGAYASGVALVVNYDLPTTQNDYGLRLCPGGHFGRKGVAINFTTSNDGLMLKAIEEFYNIQIGEMPQPIEA